MDYKYLISDKLALGYGSKYQLLRMLGWHRNDFNNAIAKAADTSNIISWLDFKYNGSEDKELLNFDFIDELKDEWKQYWVCGPSGLNWDAIGITDDGTYILLEAKANIDELESTSNGKIESKEKNNAVISNFLEENGIKRHAGDWNDKCYQMANRIIALDFLIKRGYKAKLVYVLFENGYEFNSSSNKSVTHNQWIDAMNKEFELMGIKNTNIEKLVHICIINCNRQE